MNYQEKLVEILDKLVAVRSVTSDAEPDAPFGPGPKKVLEVMADIMTDLGMTPHIVNDAMVYADWGCGDGTAGAVVSGNDSGVADDSVSCTGDYYASISHLDVVDEGTGWDTDPFTLTYKNDKYFGRGVLDNKGASAAVLCAVKELQDRGLKPNITFRLLFGSSEETHSRDVPKYLSACQPPKFAFTPDCKFPVVYAEKGIVNFVIKTHIDGASKILDIPDGQFEESKIPDKATVYVDGQKFETTGKTGHTAKPELSDNAITKLGVKVTEEWGCNSNKCEELGDSENSPHSQVSEYFGWLAGLHEDFTGDTFGFDTILPHDKTIKVLNTVDSITVVPYIIEIKGDDIFTYFTMRFPHYIKRADIESKLAQYDVTFTRQSDPAYTDPEDDNVKLLGKAYADVMGKYMEPVTSSGGTYAKKFPNTVAFGPSFPSSKHNLGIAHNANEYMTKDELFKLIEIYEKAIEYLVCR